MRRLLSLIVLIVITGCGSAFDTDAESACHSIFQAWNDAAAVCGLEATMPDPDKVCWRAYDVDDEELNGDCLPWIKAGRCEEYDNGHFQAHCGDVVSLRTW